jgi:hypothetical protein
MSGNVSFQVSGRLPAESVTVSKEIFVSVGYSCSLSGLSGRKFPGDAKYNIVVTDDKSESVSSQFSQSSL